MKKIFITLFLIFFLFATKTVFAQTSTDESDIVIICNNSGCTNFSASSLFNETNIYPGFTTLQEISIINNRKGTCYLTFKIDSNSQESDILFQKISIKISSVNSTTNYQTSTYILSNLFNSSQSLGHINKNSTGKYLWFATFNSDADNTYQNKTINFDIDFNFECDDENSIIVPTPVTVSTSSTVQGITTSNECTSSAPAAPTNLIATHNPNGSVRLSWDHSLSTHDGYLIAFGTSPGVYQYGAPNVGNVTTYTVQNLIYGAQYCFYVRSLNNCMPGDRTPEYCVNPGSAVVAADIIPIDFQPNILGDTDEITPILSETEKTNNREVLGDKDSSCTKNWLPILFFIAFFINLIYTRLPNKDKLIPLIISLTAFLIDRYLLQSKCYFGSSLLYNYFWIGNILSWLIPISIPKK